jgi:hypothetical protein
LLIKTVRFINRRQLSTAPVDDAVYSVKRGLLMEKIEKGCIKVI